jgi:hypothetical protein
MFADPGITLWWPSARAGASESVDRVPPAQQRKLRELRSARRSRGPLRPSYVVDGRRCTRGDWCPCGGLIDGIVAGGRRCGVTPSDCGVDKRLARIQRAGIVDCLVAEGRGCGVTPSVCGEDNCMAGAYPAPGRALQVSTDCRFQRRMLSGAWV